MAGLAGTRYSPYGFIVIIIVIIICIFFLYGSGATAGEKNNKEASPAGMSPSLSWNDNVSNIFFSDGHSLLAVSWFLF